MFSSLTILWLIPAVAGLFAIAFATVAVAYQNVRSPRWAAAGLGALAVAATADLAQPDTSIATLWIAGVGHWIAAGCVMQAMLERLERSMPQKIVLFGVAILAPLHAWSIFPGDMPDLRVLVVNGGAFALFALAFMRSVRTSRTRLDRVMRGIVAIVLVLYPLRMFLYFWFPPTASGTVFALSQHMLFLFTAIGVMGSGFSMALLLALGADIVQFKEHQNEVDGLTGLNNRRAFDRIVQSDRERPVYGAVMILDLDHFKQVNDTYGHEVGDRALVAVARELEAKLAGFGNVVRMGGEEFAVFLPFDNAPAAPALALAARKAVAGAKLPAPYDHVGVTASIGLAIRESGQQMLDILRIADLAMYQAKAAGRNRTFAGGRNQGLLELRAVA